MSNNSPMKNGPGVETKQIEIVVNGKSTTVSGGLTVEGLLRELAVDKTRVAVELERRIVRRGDWPTTAVASGAQVEIVQFVGGG